MSFFTTELKLPPPDKGQRFYHWANDEIIVSIFTYLSLSYQVFSPVSQHNPGILWGGREWFYNVITDTYFSCGTSWVGMGVYILLWMANETKNVVNDSGLEICISEYYGKAQKTWNNLKNCSVWQFLSLCRHLYLTCNWEVSLEESGYLMNSCKVFIFYPLYLSVFFCILI